MSWAERRKIERCVNTRSWGEIFSRRKDDMTANVATDAGIAGNGCEENKVSRPRASCHHPGQAGVLKADSKARAVVLCRPGDLLLQRSRLLRVDLEALRGLLENIMTESRGQLLAIIGEELRVGCCAERGVTS
jgi:hypothetical protein